MKKRILSSAMLAAMVLMSFFISSCATSSDSEKKAIEENGLYRGVSGSYFIDLFVDPVTKVNFWVVKGGGMAMRVDENGKPIVGYPE